MVASVLLDILCDRSMLERGTLSAKLYLAGGQGWPSLYAAVEITDRCQEEIARRQ